MINNIVTCSICEKNINKNNTFIPCICLKINREKAHRICSECWWNDFAKEDVSHLCPGCKKIYN